MSADDVPVFEFDLRATLADQGGYYYTNWSDADKITVRAANKQQAMNKAAQALGPAPRGRYWTFRVASISEVVQ